MIGNNINLGRGIIKSNMVPKVQNMTEYMTELAIAQARIISVAQATQHILNAKHIDKQIGLKKKQPITYGVNDLVLLAPHRDSLSGKRRRNDKLATALKGPYRIVNVQGSRYTLQDLATGKALPTQHASSLRQFHYNSNIVDPKEVAQRAAREYVIETITSMRGKQTNRKWNRKHLELKVHWRGSEEKDDTWEPYASVKTSYAFKTYCDNQKLAYLLPIDVIYDTDEENL